MKIPFYNIDRIYKSHKKEILRLTDSVFSGGMVIEGTAVEEMEKNLQILCGRKHAIAVNSCTDALYFSLLAASIGPGDEVIVPALSFVASATPVIRTGAKVVFADTLADGNINLKEAEKKVGKNTKAIIPVHLYGKMISPADLKKFAKKNNLFIIEDSAQALGSSYGNIPAGNTGFCSCFSFDPSKIVGAFGTGGAVLCDDDKTAAKIKAWRGQGKDKGLFIWPGYNSRLSTLQAALINLQLKNLDKIIKQRNKIAEIYYKALSELPLTLPDVNTKELTCNFHKYPVRTKQRNALKNFLNGQGIETAVHYPYLLPGQPVFGRDKGKYPVAESVSMTTLSLPIYPELSKEETDYICKQIKDFLNKVK